MLKINYFTKCFGDAAAYRAVSVTGRSVDWLLTIACRPPSVQQIQHDMLPHHRNI